MDELEAGAKRSQEEQDSEPSENSADALGSDLNSTGGERDRQVGRSGDALAWLEGPAFNEPIEELPTLRWLDDEKDEVDDEFLEGMEPPILTEDTKTNVADPAPAPDELEDAMQWLEELAKEQGTPIDEMPTLVSGGEQEQDLAANTAAALAMSQLGDTTPPPALDSDPMAWLEQLAIDQDSPLEELPSVADRLLASEIVSQIDEDPLDERPLEPLLSQPLELDDALRYLEDKAKAQGVSLDEVSFDEVELGEGSDNELKALDQMAVTLAAAVTLSGENNSPAVSSEDDDWDNLSAQIPEDPDDALAWLGELAEEESSPDQDKDRSALAKGAAAVAAARLAKSGVENEDDEETGLEQPLNDQALDMAILEGMPDDPDDAMAWMEGLARQDTDESGDEVEPPAVGFADKVVLARDEDFAAARAALLAGNVGTATKEYRKMLDGGQGGPALIGELEAAVDNRPEEIELVQLLGDAYMHDGQLQKALRTYRKGFDQL